MVQAVWGTGGISYMGNTGNGAHEQWGTGIWGIWAMGHMSNGVHG